MEGIDCRIKADETVAIHAQNLAIGGNDRGLFGAAGGDAFREDLAEDLLFDAEENDALERTEFDYRNTEIDAGLFSRGVDAQTGETRLRHVVHGFSCVGGSARKSSPKAAIRPGATRDGFPESRSFQIGVINRAGRIDE
ncbi:hypothetical protein D3C71_1842970 [compost metagenome]